MHERTESEKIAFKRIATNWQSVQSDVADALRHAHRERNQVKIIGVTKYVDAPTTALLVDAGCQALGENRPQALWQKAESDGLSGRMIDWHMIGHVQRNKLRRLLRHRPTIHSVDSQRLLDALHQEAAANDNPVQVMLEVNISGDESKTGLAPSHLLELLERADESSVRIVGLMAMAGWGTSAGEARKQFSCVRELRDRLAKKSGNPIHQLSMGMSGDFREAIAEGATMVRIGSRLFEGIER